MDELFLDYRGYKLKETIMYQDKNSDILLDNNGNDYIFQHYLKLVPRCSTVGVNWELCHLTCELKSSCGLAMGFRGDDHPVVLWF